MDPRTSREHSIQEIAKQLAEGSSSAESAKQLKELLDILAQDGDLETLPELSSAIREQVEAGKSTEDRQTLPPFAEVSSLLVKAWTGFSRLQKAAVLGGLAVLLLVVALVLANLLASPGDSEISADTSSSDPPALEGTVTVGVISKSDTATQPARVNATPTEVPPTEMPPTKAKSIAATPSESPTPALSKREYTILACVRWQDDQEAGLPGSLITWWVEQDESSREEMVIPHEDGCVKLPIFVTPNTEITLMAEPPPDSSNLQIVGHADEVGSQPVTWEQTDAATSLSLSTTLGEDTSTEYVAQFLVAAERSLSGQVVTEDGAGIPDAEVQLWSRAGPDGAWQPINPTATTGPEGTFVLTDTTGLPQVFYRVGISNPIAKRYVYTTTSVSGPSEDWVDTKDPEMPNVSFIETRTALGLAQLTVEDIVFSQALEYVLLSVPDATLEPGGLDWETDLTSTGQEEVVSKRITIDQENIDTLEARWEDVELPPGTYAMEIWTPENASARVIYSLLSSDQVLDSRVSYQSTRQDREQVNEWIDFSITLNPSLIVELPAAAPITVVAEPSSRLENRDYNLGGNILFGVGPVRFVKQQ